jgi:hypothetical protein
LTSFPDARIGIARDLALLVYDGRMIGWSRTDPARHVRPASSDPTPHRGLSLRALREQTMTSGGETCFAKSSAD